MRNLHPTVRHRVLDVDIDVEIVPLVDALMDAGCVTTNSCQGGAIEGYKPIGYVGIAQGTGERALLSLSQRPDVGFDFITDTGKGLRLVTDEPRSDVRIEIYDNGRWTLRFHDPALIDSLVHTLTTSH